MHEIVEADLKVERAADAARRGRRDFKQLGENYKAEIIASIPANEDISLYGQGDWFDLCRGPHLPQHRQAAARSS